MSIKAIGDLVTLQALSTNASTLQLACNNATYKLYRGGTNWTDPKNESWPTQCLEGYGGNLCDTCIYANGAMHSRINKHQCLRCSDN